MLSAYDVICARVRLSTTFLHYSNACIYNTKKLEQNTKMLGNRSYTHIDAY